MRTSVTRGTNPVIANLGIAYNPSNPDANKYTVVTGRGNLPVNGVSWYSAIRFANWLNNGQGNGDTETGAYTLLGGTRIPSNGLAITRNPGATVFLPNENEWYKAAYYNPASSSYFLYPTSSNTPPLAEPPPGGTNSANWQLAAPAPLMTNVGAYFMSSSPYGTFDQAGNVWEWNETLVRNEFRGLRGGSYSLDPFAMPNDLISTYRNFFLPGEEEGNVGFRVASVPEPRSAFLVVIGGILLWLGRNRAAATEHLRVGRIIEPRRHATSTADAALPDSCSLLRLIVAQPLRTGSGCAKIEDRDGNSYSKN